jgi:RNA-splicing ligase RtcB
MGTRSYIVRGKGSAEAFQSCAHGAYKDIDEVMANQSDLVEVLHTLKQILCVKG